MDEANDDAPNPEVQQASQTLAQLRDELAKAFIGQTDLVHNVIDHPPD